MKKNKNWLFITVAALSLGVGVNTYSTKAYASISSKMPVTNTKTQKVDTNKNVESGTWGSCPWNYNKSTKILTLGDPNSITSGESVKYSSVTGNPPTSPFDEAYSDGCKEIDILGRVKLPANCAGLFTQAYGVTKITHIDLLDSSNVTNMNSMFSGDKSLVSLDLSHFDTSNVTDMAYMFDEDQNLKKLNISNFNTSKVTNMEEMLSGISLTSIDLKNFDTSNVTDMSTMFDGDSYLKTLDLSSFNTSKVTNMYSMFSTDRSLASIDVSSFNTSKVSSMNGMFFGCNSLKSLDLSNFDTSTPSIDLNQMFWSDPELTTLDISNFNIPESEAQYEQLFFDDPKLSVLRLGSKINNKALTNLPKHSSSTVIPDSNPQKLATGPGWMAVEENNGGTVSNPQGKTVYDSNLSNRPAETETYVWQQESTPVAKPTLSLKETTHTMVQGQQWDPKDAIKSALNKDGQDDKNSVTISAVAVDSPNKQVSLKDITKLPAGDYTLTYNYSTAEPVTLKLTIKAPSTSTTPSTSSTPTTSGSSSTPTSSSSSSSSTSSTTTPSSSTPTSSSSASSSSHVNLPNYAATKGTVVYAINKIGLYQSTKFSAAKRSAWYTRKPRIYRPMFVVTGYSRDSNGRLRYEVKDVNHASMTDGKTGYITASQKYVRPVYYATKHSTVTVINPHGVSAYRKANLTKRVKNYRQGTVLHVKAIVTHNLTTRYVLTNGDYITANRKLVNMGRHKQVKVIKTKRALNRYGNVNFTKKNHVIAKNRTLKAYGYDYSHGNSMTKRGTLRYRVAGGYVTANTKYVRAYK